MLKKKRIEKGLTQSELAKKIGISKSYLNKLENRKYNNTTINVLLKLSKELDIFPIELFLFFIEIDFNSISHEAFMSFLNVQQI